MKCDICDGNDGEYAGYNSTYGYCAKPECKKEANARVGAEIYDAAGRGDYDEAEELIGDGDIFDFI